MQFESQIPRSRLTGHTNLNTQQSCGVLTSHVFTKGTYRHVRQADRLRVNKFSKNNKGFTLLELIVTVVILALITAPFLSSFASASKTNVKSKRIQEANELSQRIIEQFKATTVSQLTGEYSLSLATIQIDTSDPSGMYSKNSNKYTGTVGGTSSVSVPGGFASGYSADITLTPSKSVANEDEAVPVIDDLNRKKCVVIAGNITKFDTQFPTADHRDVTVRVYKDPASGKYKVDLEIIYKELSGVQINSQPKGASWEYDEIPSIYILYVPMGAAPATSNDTITIENNLSGTELEYTDADGNTQNGVVNAYIIKQSAAPTDYANVNSGNVTVKDKKPDGTLSVNTLNNLLNPSHSAALNTTVLYTNIGMSASAITDRNDTVNGVVKTLKIDTIYTLDVDVKYDGQSIAKYNATKTTSGD